MAFPNPIAAPVTTATFPINAISELRELITQLLASDPI